MIILVPRAHDPSSISTDMRRALTLSANQIFSVLTNESESRGLEVLEAARGLHSWRRPEGSRPMETRM